jgi:hypothetical protein
MGKVDLQTVKWFEHEQEIYGTEVAIKNLLFKMAEDILKDIGATKVEVEYDNLPTNWTKDDIYRINLLLGIDDAANDLEASDE